MIENKEITFGNSLKTFRKKFHAKREIFLLIMGILFFIISYNFDKQTALFFKDVNFIFFDIILGITANFGIVILVMLVIPSFILYKKNRKFVHLLLLTFFISFALAFIIKLIVSRQRPIEAFTYPLTSIINYSFPSMHSMVVFALLPVLVKYMPKQRIFWVTFAFLVAFSRIYFGFHFLSDVVFGALAGCFIGYFVLELNKKGRLWE